MAVDLGPFELAAPPGTGANWVMGECKRVGLCYPQSGIGVYNVFSKESADKFRLSLVRHPCRWLSCIYTAINEGVAMGEDLVDFFVLSDGNDFDAFIRNYLKHAPGRVGRLFDSYKCNTRMRLEDMPWALMEFLESVGIPERMLNLVSDPGRFFIVDSEQEWDEKLFQEVIEAESDLCLDFDYY